MRPILLLALAALCISPGTRAAQTPDPVLVDGLQACVNNGIEAGLRTWYADRPALAVELKERLLTATRHLGEIIDTEIVAIQPVSKRVTRYHVAIYFTRCPLWVRIERYANRDKAFYLPLKYSTEPDDILPGYLTEFRQQL